MKIQTNANFEENQQEAELMQMSISSEVIESRADAEPSLKKVKKSEQHLQQALQA